MSEDEKKEYGSGRMSAYGYVVEWRLKPDSASLESLCGYGFARADTWSQAPYLIDQLGRHASGVEKLVRPYIRQDDERIAEHGLCRRDVAEAVMACLKTSIESKFLDHLEWRIARIEAKSEYTLTRSEDHQELEQRTNEVHDMLTAATS